MRQLHSVTNAVCEDPKLALSRESGSSSLAQARRARRHMALAVPAPLTLARAEFARFPLVTRAGELAAAGLPELLLLLMSRHLLHRAAGKLGIDGAHARQRRHGGRCAGPGPAPGLPLARAWLARARSRSVP